MLSNPVLTPRNPSTEVILNVGIPSDTYGLAGVGWSTHVTEPGWDPASFDTLLPHSGQTAGELSPDGKSITGQTAGQLIILGFVPEPGSLDVWRGVFTVTDFSTSRDITLSTETNRYLVYETSAPTSAPLAVRRLFPTEAEATIRVIPAPAPLAMLAAGMLLATRRRRSQS